MQLHFARYYFPLHKMLLILATILGKKKAKTSQCQNWIFKKKYAVVIIWEKTSYFFKEKVDFRGGGLTSCFREHYYNAGLIFGHL